MRRTCKLQTAALARTFFPLINLTMKHYQRACYIYQKPMKISVCFRKVLRWILILWGPNSKLRITEQGMLEELLRTSSTVFYNIAFICYTGSRVLAYWLKLWSLGSKLCFIWLKLPKVHSWYLALVFRYRANAVLFYLFYATTFPLMITKSLHTHVYIYVYVHTLHIHIHIYTYFLI